MKKILITGINSYIGNSFSRFLLQYPSEYEIEKISLRDGEWRKKDFSKYHSILHVAGIAHVSKDPKMKEQYYRINTEMTIEIARKAKAEGVNQFIFLSSIIVYGNKEIKNGVIDSKTTPKPNDFYGDSKLKAEKGIAPLKDDCFKVVIIRPPMIYGLGSKGNYPKLAKLAQKTPLFPKVENKRSMIHIDNLCEFMKFMIDNEETGLFFPQNKEYVKTSEMVKLIAETYGKKVRFVKWFNPIIYLTRNKVEIVNKVFGNFVYEKSMSKYKENYQIRDFKTSIQLTEKINL